LEDHHEICGSQEPAREELCARHGSRALRAGEDPFRGRKRSPGLENLDFFDSNGRRLGLAKNGEDLPVRKRRRSP
jgi:hypothetical protein